MEQNYSWEYIIWYNHKHTHIRSWGSSVSIVSDYSLDDRGSISGKGKGLSSSLCVQTSSEIHPASCPMDTRVLSRGKGRPGHDADYSQPYSAEVKNA
jgi:hypothetical protein